ncbi:hypothetical protein [Microbacterium sp. RG1]|uniref:hypothetical protein n=1 Tax=Microbacterium sp. RG1 TaxID=2489212 RepID=UPI0010CA5EFA|nr:hypothetical protein [Microbacterium sp. RG1]QCQ16981.1 hypothetical protein EHF32_09765 [Microbacterium sp. RG1]
MTEPVLVAIVTAGGGLAVAIVGAVLAPLVLARLRAIEAQVANDHRHPDGTPINLRDDLDNKHDENRGILLTIQRDVAWLMRRQADTDDRLDGIEDTITKEKKA